MGGRIGGEGGYCDGSIASGVGNLFHQLMSSSPSRPLHQRHGFLFPPSIQTSLFISQFIPLSCFTALVPSPALPRLSLAEAGWKHSHSDHILHPHPPFLFLSLSSFSRSYIIADFSRVLTLSWWTLSLSLSLYLHPRTNSLVFSSFLSFSTFPSLSLSLLTFWKCIFIHDRVEDGWGELKVDSWDSVLSLSSMASLHPSTLLSLNHIYVLLTFIYPGEGLLTVHALLQTPLRPLQGWSLWHKSTFISGFNKVMRTLSFLRYKEFVVKDICPKLLCQITQKVKAVME